MSLRISAAALVVVASLIAPTPIKDASASASMPTFVTYNVRNCCEKVGGRDTVITGERSWVERRARVANVLAASQADVIALQEATPYNNESGRTGADTIDPAVYLLAKLNAPAVPKGPVRKYELATQANKKGRPIFYDSEIFREIEVIGGAAIPSTVGEGSVALLERISDGTRIMVGNIHLPVRKDGDPCAASPASEKERQDKMRTLVQTVRPIAQAHAGGRAIYLGDMNTWPGRKLKTGDNCEDPAEQDLSDAVGQMMSHAAIPEAQFACTGACSTEGYSSLSHFKPRKKGPIYDRAFVKKARVVGWEVMSKVSHLASDHFPVKITLTL